MKQHPIINIQEIASLRDGVSYKGEIAVFISRPGPDFVFFDGDPVYINAFTYFVPTCGTADFISDGMCFRAGPDTLGMISPLHLTCFRNVSGDFRCIFMSVTKEFADRIAAPSIQNRIVYGIRTHSTPLLPITGSQNALLQKCLLTLHDDISCTGHRFRTEMIQNSLVRFYLELDNIYESVSSGTAQPRYATVLKRFIGLLMANFRECHTVPFYAEAMNVSPQYLTSIVKRQTGKSVSMFICEMLHSEARKLLASSDMSIQQIAGILHFSDQSSFTKFFRRQAGMSPKKYRRQSLCLADVPPSGKTSAAPNNTAPLSDTVLRAPEPQRHSRR